MPLLPFPSTCCAQEKAHAESHRALLGLPHAHPRTLRQQLIRDLQGEMEERDRIASHSTLSDSDTLSPIPLPNFGRRGSAVVDVTYGAVRWSPSPR